MLVLSKISESPDGGDTVYSRESGSTERTLIREGRMRQLLRRSELWSGIFQVADQDPELQRLIEQVEIFYKLRYNPLHE